ncbi:MAG: HrpE/YscL family type III secretion apparatus protein [Rubrivivax sp.]|nr:MAG: HrpE/YscL family type III secretion apparatus protein [Rubrivivax sp.]
MLIWWKTSTQPSPQVSPRAHDDEPAAGAPYGILRASEVTLLRHDHEIRQAATARAEALIAQAQTEAERILSEAQARAEALLRDAQTQIDAACESGRAEGERQAALAWHERQAGRAVDQADAVRGLHERMAEVVTSAVERIVQTEGRAALYQRALRSVQALSRSATALTLKVSSADFDAARDGIAAVPELQSAGLSVEVIVDPALPAGSCLFESDMGVVDASLKTQLDALRSAMSRAVKRAVAES